MELTTFSNKTDFIDTSAALIKDIITQTDQPRIGLSGGQTPRPIYQALSATGVDVSATTFVQVDERYVPHDHSESNYHTIRHALLDNLPSPPAAFYFFNVLLPVRKALKEYKKIVKKNTPLDLCILGMGSDGHVASLFPHAEILKTKRKLVARTTTNTHSIENRLTLTFPAILKSRRILLLVEGMTKKQAVLDLMHSEKSLQEMPAKRLLEHEQCIVHFGDY